MNKIDEAYQIGLSKGYDRGALFERVRIMTIFDEIRKKYPANHTLEGASTHGIGPLAEFEQRVYEER